MHRRAFWIALAAVGAAAVVAVVTIAACGGFVALRRNAAEASRASGLRHRRPRDSDPELVIMDAVAPTLVAARTPVGAP